MSDLHVYDTTLRDGAQQEGSTSRSSTSWPSPRTSTSSGSASSRAAGPAPTPRTPSSSRGPRHELHAAQRHPRGVRRHPPGRRVAPPTTRWCARCSTPGAPVVTLVAKSHVRHVETALRTTRAENLAMVRDTVALPARRGAAGVPGRRALLRRLRRRPRLRARGACAPRPRPAPRSSRCATPTAACCPPQVADVVRRRPRRHRRARSASTATTTPAARSPTRSPRSTPGATHVQGTVNGYGERTGNADLLTVVAQPPAQAGPPGPARPTRLRGGHPHRPRDQRGHQRPAVLAASRTSARAPSRTRPACTPARIKVDPDLYQHTDPQRGRQRHADAGLRHGRPRQHRAQGPRAGLDLVRPADELLARVARPRSRTSSCAATPSTRPTPRSSCCCASEVDGARLDYFEVESLAGHHRLRPARATALSEATVKLVAGGRARASPRARATARSTRSTTPCAQALATGLPRDRQARADRLPGAHPRRRARHRRGHPGAHRDLRRRDVLGDRRGRRRTSSRRRWQALVDGITYGLLRQGVPVR